MPSAMENQSCVRVPSEAGNVKTLAVDEPDAQPLCAAYGLSPEQVAFFRAQTGIQDDDDFKTHVLGVQERAYQIIPYPCIKWFMFMQLGIATLPEYENIINIGRVRPNGILLDVGCCFGADARKAVADGFPLKNVVTTDLQREFHDLGHALFKTTPVTYPISFVAGDAFDPNVLQIVPPLDEPPLTERPDLLTLTSLNPLAGRCAVIHISNFFHLFPEEKQLHMAKALAGLLSPEPGSMICGEHSGDWEKQIFRGDYEGMTFDTVLHSPESWSAIWDGEVFANGKVRVHAKIESSEKAPGLTYKRLQWSVVRL